MSTARWLMKQTTCQFLGQVSLMSSRRTRQVSTWGAAAETEMCEDGSKALNVSEEEDVCSFTCSRASQPGLDTPVLMFHSLNPDVQKENLSLVSVISLPSAPPHEAAAGKVWQIKRVSLKVQSVLSEEFTVLHLQLSRNSDREHEVLSGQRNLFWCLIRTVWNVDDRSSYDSWQTPTSHCQQRSSRTEIVPTNTKRD